MVVFILFLALQLDTTSSEAQRTTYGAEDWTWARWV